MANTNSIEEIPLHDLAAKYERTLGPTQEAHHGAARSLAAVEADLDGAKAEMSAVEEQKCLAQERCGVLQADLDALRQGLHCDDVLAQQHASALREVRVAPLDLLLPFFATLSLGCRHCDPVLSSFC
jgi:septal ring factor EnvC (AmiA/AmiB activator)